MDDGRVCAHGWRRDKGHLAQIMAMAGSQFTRLGEEMDVAASNGIAVNENCALVPVPSPAKIVGTGRKKWNVETFLALSPARLLAF